MSLCSQWLPTPVRPLLLLAGLLGLLLQQAGCLKPYCEADTDCAEGQRCNLDRHRCEAMIDPTDGGMRDGGDGGDAGGDGGSDAATGCTSLSCENPTPICDATSLECRGCDGDPECLDLGVGRPWCDEGACVGCFDSLLHCGDVTPLCDATSLECVACALDDECVSLEDDRPWCADGACVECTDSAQCLQVGAAVCDPLAQVCRACESHAECEHLGGVCDEGTCLVESLVLYVVAGGTCAGATGSRAAPFCQISDALTATWSGRRVIHVGDGTYSPITLRDTDAWILGAGNGVIVDALGATAEPVWVTIGMSGEVTTARLENLTIQGSGGSRSGLFCNSAVVGELPSVTLFGCTITANAGSGVHASGCSLTMTKSLVTGNTQYGFSLSESTLALDRNRVEGNTNGGLVISACTGRVANNLIIGNGSSNSSVGGIIIPAVSGTLEILFNTVAGNLVSEFADEPGLICNNPPCPGIVLSSNLFTNPVTPSRPDVSAAFAPRYCFLGTGDLGTGQGNINGDPGIVDLVEYRLKATSPCRGAGEPGLGVISDLDGESRPQPAGSDPDIGADEVP